MKKITAICFFLLPFQAIFPGSPITGGDSYAAQAYGEYPIFEVQIENNVSKVMTIMTVYAPTEQQAREQVSLNGWRVVDIRMLTEKEVQSFDLSAAGMSSLTSQKVTADSPLRQKKREPILEEEDPAPFAEKVPEGYPLGIGGQNPYSGKTAAKKDAWGDANLSPDSPGITRLAVVTFPLGAAEPEETWADRISNLPKNGRYVLFGHADEISVGKNADYADNFELSFLRALKIRELMAEKGVPADNIRVVGLGDRYPALKNGDGFISDRRVEIYGFGTQN